MGRARALGYVPSVVASRLPSLRSVARLATLGLILGSGCVDAADEPRDDAAAATAAPQPLAPEAQQRMEELLALGYVEGSEPAPEPRGVTIHEPGRASPGLSLLNSGHAPEAELLDMQGRVLHRWRRAFRDVWPDHGPTNWLRTERYFRRVHLLPDGDLLAIFDGLGLVRLRPDSSVRWAYAGRAHHDLFVNEDGSIHVLTRHERKGWAGDPDAIIWEDFVTLLDADGRELRSVSLLAALQDSRWSHWLEQAKPKGDLFHTNTLEVLSGPVDERLAKAFRPGNVLVSLHQLHALAVVDLDLERVVWGLRGSWRYQHQPTLLENGHLLLFDNLGTPQRSSVIEIDPVGGQEVWRYQPDAPDAFFSFCCGSVQPLPNGNILVSESQRGRAFEITRQGEIVWEYWNPHRVGAQREKIANLFELQRLPADLPRPWLRPPADG